MAEEIAEETAEAPNGAVVRLYTKRLRWTPAAIVGLIFVISGFAMTRSVLVCGTRGCVPGLLAGAACIVLGAPIALLGLYYVLTPIPLLCLDQVGMLYQKSPMGMVRVRWEDVQVIRANKRRYNLVYPTRRAAQLDLYLTMKTPVATTYGLRRNLLWQFSGANLPIAPEQLVEQIQRFHPIIYTDEYANPGTSRFHVPAGPRGKPSRQARWAARHPAETGNQFEGANDR